MCCKEYESPTRTVHAAIESYAHKRIWSGIPDLWQDDVVIFTKVDVITDRLCIDAELLCKKSGVAYEIRDITSKYCRGDIGSIDSELAYVLKEFGERTFIKTKY